MYVHVLDVVIGDLHIVHPQRNSVLVIQTNHNMRVFGQIREIEVVAGNESARRLKAVQRGERPLGVHLVAARPPLSHIESVLHIHHASRSEDIIH